MYVYRGLLHYPWKLNTLQFRIFNVMVGLFRGDTYVGVIGVGALAALPFVCNVVALRGLVKCWKCIGNARNLT